MTVLSLLMLAASGLRAAAPMAGAEAGVAAKMADGRTVAFDLPAIGVSFVRMVPEN